MRNQPLFSPDSAPGLDIRRRGPALWRKSPFLYTVALRESRQAVRNPATSRARNEPLEAHINFRSALQSEL